MSLSEGVHNIARGYHRGKLVVATVRRRRIRLQPIAEQRACRSGKEESPAAVAAQP